MAEFDSEASANRMTALCERLRIAQILDAADELDRCPKVARHLAFNTDMTSDQARGLFMTIPSNAKVLQIAAANAADAGEKRLKVVSA